MFPERDIVDYIMTQALEKFTDRLLIVGCGHMAGAMLARWLHSGLAPSLVEIIDPALPKPSAAIDSYPDVASWSARAVTQSPAQFPAQSPDWVILGIKPQSFGDVVAALSAVLADKTRVLSIQAGVSLADLKDNFPSCGGYARVLPNMAAQIGESMSVYATLDLSAASCNRLEELLHRLGRVLAMTDDSRMDLVTAYTGSGPAFVARLIEAYVAAGERLGFSDEEALTLALATFGGTAALLQANGMKPSDLIAQVASQGGVTQAGLDVLDTDGRWMPLMSDVLRTTRDRGRELAEDLRQENQL